MTRKYFIKEKLANREYYFWYGHSLFWIAVLIQKIPLNLDLFQSFQLFLSLFSSISLGFCITFIMRIIYKKYSWHRFKMHYLIILIFIYSSFITIVWLYVIIISDHLIAGDSLYFSYYSLLRWITNNYLVMFLWNSLYLGYKIYEEWNIQKFQLEQERTLLKTAQLDVLKYQLNPHFLFNTLNSAKALVLADPPLARDMLTQISEFLRYSLSEGKNSTVPLVREMEAITTYLDIEKIRYKENLIIECKIDPKAEGFEIPVFLILPLVENAVKHGMRTTALPLKINLNAQLVNGYIQIDIINSGKWIDTPSKELNTGTGLNNVQKRLANTYSSSSNLEIIRKDDSIHVIMKIKKEN